MREGPQLSNEQREKLVIPITDKEIEDALQSIGDLKSPGIDGYGAYFFKKAWNIVKTDVLRAAHDFFENGRLYKAANCTLVTLIPKTNEAKRIKEYRPISCCITIYKIISKVLTKRMGEVMTNIIGQNQAAFVPGQIIHNHILLTYELIKGYNRKGGTPRCMMQLDIQKAYDTIDWKAIECVLNEVGFPKKFTNWIMIAVTSVSYRFNINGNYTNIMKANCGLRQGDLISPLLFVIMMEYLNRCFQKMQKNHNFNFHAKCEKLDLTNLCFADDLLLFASGDKGSVTIMMDTFDKFSNSTDLRVNPSKCCIFFGGVDQSTKNDIKKITHFDEGTLPFRYLGILMTSKKLSIHNYMGLIVRIVGRITHRSSKLLSYARRIQLLNSVIFAMTNYWLQCLPFPKAVIKKINSICCTFLWTGSIEKSRKASVAWKSVCQPKRNGGLNIIDLEVWNRITLLKLLWNLSGKSDNLWKKWVHVYYIKNQHIMEARVPDNASWIMKAIMQQREDIRQNQVWIEIFNTPKFKMKKMYMAVHDRAQKVVWRTLFYGNVARPRALITLWLACHERLATRDRLHKYGAIDITHN
ncbi:ribonuclease H [Trifolium pratense]|uniref:Ribonuclease H n=1 Tax=Trifolium pratense TaxID=57577 RepID=A0A2K3MUX9_TRIPR|nr:ribonuclease H [Trifolium pratense]